MLQKLVSNQLSPDFTWEDRLYAFARLRWVFNRSKRQDFSAAFKTSNYRLLNMARSALRVLAQSGILPQEKEIGLPAFCCAVMATPFLEEGYKICWIDTDEQGLLSISDLAKKIDRISLVVVPHVFGQKVDMQALSKLAWAKGVFVIEDGAHRIESDLTFCDAKILSFGREKVVSCVSGGAVLWREDSPLKQVFDTASLGFPSFWWTAQHLLQPVILGIALPLWRWGNVGKTFAWLCNRLRILPRAVTKAEKEGFDDIKPTQMPYALQGLLWRSMQQYKDLEEYRKHMAQWWEDMLSEVFPKAEIIIPENAFRVILKTDHAVPIKQRSLAAGFDLREWDGIPISPAGVELGAFYYSEGLCPVAEHFSTHYVTFPTNRRTNQGDIIRFGKLFEQSYDV